MQRLFICKFYKKIKNIVEKDRDYIYMYFEDNKDLDKLEYLREYPIMR